MQYNGIDFETYFKNYPDENGFFGRYGGCYVSDELKQAMNALVQLAVYYGVEQELEASIDRSLAKMKDEGLLE